jgi:glucokinase
MQRTAIGIDIGGTTIVGGLVDLDHGTLLARQRIPTDSRLGIPDGLARIDAMIRALCDAADLTVTQLTGVGVGASGPVDAASGEVRNPYTLPGWPVFPIIPHLMHTFGLPAALLGDCDTALLGEAWVGAARGLRNVVYVTAGTGIGGAVMIDGRLHRPVGGASTEIGHCTIDMHGPRCYCGANGCWEVLASAPAIVRRARAAYTDAPADAPLLLMADGLDGITARLVSEAAAAGDSRAQAQVEQTATYMGIGLANIMSFLGPQAIVLGGGVFEGGWPSFEPVARRVIAERSSLVPFEQIALRPAALGLDAGVLGAAWFVAASQSPGA